MLGTARKMCAVCDVMEMCVSDCIRISEKTRHTRFRLGARKTPVISAVVFYMDRLFIASSWSVVDRYNFH